MEDFSLGSGDLWVVGVHPGEPQYDRKVLGDCDKEIALILMEGADSEKKGHSAMGGAVDCSVVR